MADDLAVQFGDQRNGRFAALDEQRDERASRSVGKAAVDGVDSREVGDAAGRTRALMAGIHAFE